MQRYRFTPFRVIVAVAAFAIVIVLSALAGTCQYLASEVPDVAVLRDIRLRVPLRIYSRDGALLGQIGEQRRVPLSYQALPKQIIDAFLAAEDDRFFEHDGVDYAGLLRAAWVNIRTGGKREGGGTITMQLARNFFLSPRKTYKRKLLEILTALKIEREFSKKEIISLYLNKIFLGERAYGVGAAAEIYFGKRIDELSLQEIATIAGITPSPSRFNPLVSPASARRRRKYVLHRMLELGDISTAEYHTAVVSPLSARLHGPSVDLEAPDVAEMVRLQLLDRFGPRIYTDGYKVVTTLDSRLQKAAVDALRAALIEYDQRHGFRGPVGHVTPKPNWSEASFASVLERYPARGALRPAIIIGGAKNETRAYAARIGGIALTAKSVEWARRRSIDSGDKTPGRSSGEQLRVGDIVYVAPDGARHWQLLEVPEVQGAFVAIDPRDGAILALAGGFDYFDSSFNRAVHARRQPGSTLKPFLYSAALERGYTPATLINDAPLMLDEPTQEAIWRPQNASQEFDGPTTLRDALVRSRNLVSIRVLQDLGLNYAIDYMQRFGFSEKSLPRNLTLALGTSLASPLEMAGAYAVFANGGFKVDTHLVDRVTDFRRETLWSATPRIACDACEVAGDLNTRETLKAPTIGARDQQKQELPEEQGKSRLEAPRVISAQNAYLMTDMMRDVIQRGTAQRARVLDRHDIAGKTGTTNNNGDAWFCGYTSDLVGIAWVGFDRARSLGPGEEGARTALPMWIDFMREALKHIPERHRRMPPGVVTMSVSAKTGRLTHPDDPDAKFEPFMQDHIPEGSSMSDYATTNQSQGADKPLF